MQAGLGSRGEYGFSVGRRQIGHLHGDHAAHFGFPRDVGAELREQGRVGPQTDLVTMTIGGNDSGVFINTILACGTEGTLALGQGSPCKDKYGDSFEKRPLYLIFISSVFPMIVQTTAGVHTIEKRYLRAAENFDVSRFTLFSQVVIPAVLPQIIVGMRIGLGVAWLVVVAAEMIALNTGLGYLIMDSRFSLQTSRMIVGLIALLLGGVGVASGVSSIVARLYASAARSTTRSIS
mgnify:CR=1 FL=1